MTLTGKTVLITRAADQADSFAKIIKERGGTPVIFPTIEIHPPESLEQLDRAIDGLYMYDGVIFTSTNGVKFFFRRLVQRDVTINDVKRKRIFVVGEKTRRAVEEHGVAVAAIPEKFTAADLTKIIDHEDLHGRTFLFPCGSLSPITLADTLKLLGASVDSVIVYQTKRPQQKDVANLQRMLFDDQIDVITFTSPSTFKNFVMLFSRTELRKLQDHTRIAVIGPATAHAVNEAGLEVDISSEKSTTESLLDAIAAAFQSTLQNPKTKLTP